MFVKEAWIRSNQNTAILYAIEEISRVEPTEERKRRIACQNRNFLAKDIQDRHGILEENQIPVIISPMWKKEGAKDYLLSDNAL